MEDQRVLKEAIAREISRFSEKQLLEASEQLTNLYRAHLGKTVSYMTSEVHRCAYLITRFPATFAAIYKALLAGGEVIEEKIESLTDLGAGPGTAGWAACEAFPSIERITFFEQDASLIAMGQRLAKGGGPTLNGAKWIQGDLEKFDSFPESDLVILSYCIGELSSESLKELIEKAWKSTKKFLLCIEPGTPKGFERIRLVRSLLIDLKGSLVAPCPGEMICPMKEGDWCHFAARVERSSLHRRLKGGSLGHEDEKFSYVLFSKEQNGNGGDRILRHPLKRSGHVHFKLCTLQGVQDKIVTKKQGALYKLARDLEWGDEFKLINKSSS